MPEAAPSTRESIEAAIEKLSGAPGGDDAPPPQTPAPGDAPPPQLPETPAPGDTPPPPQNPAQPQQSAAPKPASGVPPSQAKQAAIGQQPPTVPQGLRAPASWKPEFREKWAAVPPELQAEIHRREREIVTALNTASGDRKQLAAFNSAMEPYKHLIAMEGGDPVKAFGDYLRTTAILRSGAPGDKANALAYAVKQFGVDVNLLDQALTMAIRGGQFNPAQPQIGGQAQQFQDPRVDKLLEQMEATRQAQASQIEQEAATELEAFAADPKNEFLGDVRETMADILDVAAARGRIMTVQQAYDMACTMTPEIQKVIQQRSLAAGGAPRPTPPNVLASKRNAAGGVRNHEGAGAADGGGNKAPSVRESIVAAIDQLS